MLERWQKNILVKPFYEEMIFKITFCMKHCQLCYLSCSLTYHKFLSSLLLPYDTTSQEHYYDPIVISFYATNHSRSTWNLNAFISYLQLAENFHSSYFRAVASSSWFRHHFHWLICLSWLLFQKFPVCTWKEGSWDDYFVDANLHNLVSIYWFLQLFILLNLQFLSLSLARL